ncbi:MAG: hypothetical protein Q9160_005522 [Pyrenula sp. 1 TL-2023]
MSAFKVASLQKSAKDLAKVFGNQHSQVALSVIGSVTAPFATINEIRAEDKIIARVSQPAIWSLVVANLLFVCLALVLGFAAFRASSQSLQDLTAKLIVEGMTALALEKSSYKARAVVSAAELFEEKFQGGASRRVGAQRNVDGAYDLVPSRDSEQMPVQQIEINSKTQEALRAEVFYARKLTKAIAILPYEACLWLRRGLALENVGYPELAIGDYYKARLLYDAARNPGDELGEKAKFANRMRSWLEGINSQFWSNEMTTDMFDNSPANVQDKLLTLVLIRSLFQARCYADACRLCQDALRIYPEDLVLKGSPIPQFAGILELALKLLKEKRQAFQQRESQELPSDREKMKAHITGGLVKQTSYPWIKSRTSGRPLTAYETVLQRSHWPCRLGPTSLKGLEDPESSLGLLAKQYISSGHMILEDRALIQAYSRPERCHHCGRNFPQPIFIEACDCKLVYCSEVCAMKGARYHQNVCGRDFSFIHKTPKSLATSFQKLVQELQCKAVAFMKSQTEGDPLRSAITGHLSGTCLRELHFTCDYVWSIQTLLALAIDPFADLRFDTWVLADISSRQIANRHGISLLDGSMRISLGTYTPFINHSCTPNVRLDRYEGHNLVRVIALRNIQPGEELYANYVDWVDITKLSYGDRDFRLRGWMPDGCRCKRCRLMQ